jgi:hypothetical protein
MPPMPGMELGEPPPAVPRDLPRGFVTKQYLKTNVANIFGLILTGMGGIMGLMLLLINPWFALFPAVIFIGGMLLLRHGIGHARGILRAYRHGSPVQGGVLSTTRMTSESHNGEHPWKLSYQFTIEGEIHEGSLIAFDDNVGKMKPRQPLWILHLREDASINTVYPPFR